MILTGKNSYKGFAEQKTFSFDCSFLLSNATGISSIGISGESGRFDLFSFKTGRIYDCSNRFVECYSANEELNISGNFSSGNFGYFINEIPISLNTTVCSSSLSFDNLVFSTTGCFLDCKLNVYGQDTPEYEIIFNQKSITGNRVTGYIKNVSKNSFNSFKLFSNSGSFYNYNYSVASNLSGLKIKPNNFGVFFLDYIGGSDFILDEKKQVSPLSGELNFSTNFGEISQDVNIALDTTPYYYTNFEIESSGTYLNTGSFWNIDLERQACSGTRFEFTLDDVRWLDPNFSFSGSFLIKTGYNNDRFVSKNVSYSSPKGAYVGTGFLSGAGCSGNDTLKYRAEILHSHPSGIYLNKFKYSISGIEDKSLLFTGFLEELNE